MTLKPNKFSIYQSEGILGKLEIRDEPNQNDSSIIERKLLINNIVQTEMNLQNHQSVSDYVRLLDRNKMFFPKGKMLILGLGGGVVANMFQDETYDVTAVEFDERIIEMSKRFFYLNDSIKTICSDARYYINHSSEKYNVILFDVFKAEEQPSHIITQESLIKLKMMLDTNGLVLINTHGYLKDKKGLGTQCLLATLKDAGFNIKICTSSEEEDYRNLLIVASQKPLLVALNNELSPIIYADLKTINTDNQPIMEVLNASANQSWRSNYLKNYIIWNY